MISSKNSILTLSGLALTAAVFLPGANAQGDPKSAASVSAPVVVELFTSQSCSSCPPADALAQELAHDPGFLMIVRPVTYWDRLGWKDTLAREENTALQRAYARKGNEGAGVYTPQMVVDGRHGAVGSNFKKVRQLAAAARGNDPAVIALNPLANGGIAIGLGGKSAQPAELVLLALDSHERVPIGRGENSGKTVDYTNVVRAEMRIADWQGGKGSVVIRPEQLKVPKADRYALVLREKNAGAILAGKMLPAR
ncbi:DUF1223 domain-containing protein [Altererythrobacter sp. ZODW24]|uniref:DUF1223 domain-containing protein n=1 Tax=Altererythrobacter sp. ZODW24 TaxID=2185142 RepID=UPI000DF75854|nr:DUF1223 domain-containing protein [Altererythrobacter sp. ZODW24]